MYEQAMYKGNADVLSKQKRRLEPKFFRKKAKRSMWSLRIARSEIWNLHVLESMIALKTMMQVTINAEENSSWKRWRFYVEMIVVASWGDVQSGATGLLLYIASSNTVSGENSITRGQPEKPGRAQDV